MSKFKFRFEVVEKVRKIREDIALRELSEANQLVQEAQSTKTKLENELQTALIGREKLGETTIYASEIAIQEMHVQGLKQRITQQNAAIFRAKKSFEKAIRKYLVLRKQTQTIEKMREKDWIEFRKQASKLEQKTIDEIISHFQIREGEVV